MVGAVIIIVIGLVVAGMVTVAVFAMRRRAPVTVPAAQGSAARIFDTVEPDAEPFASPTGGVEVAAPALGPPLFDLDLDLEPDAPPGEIRWSKQFDRRSGSLDDTARLRLIGDLGVVAKEWCVPLLCQAYEEERRPANRQAALISLAACRSRAAVPTYRLAMASGDLDERAIVADALADLEPPAQTKPWTVVQRR